MGRKRAHELQTHRLVSSGAGASAVSTNTSRAPTEPAAAAEGSAGAAGKATSPSGDAEELARLEKHEGLAFVLSGLLNRRHNELHAALILGPYHVLIPWHQPSQHENQLSYQ